MFSNIFNIIQAPLFNILFLVAVAWSVAIFLERFRIPLIIGELVAGIIIGPAVLGIIHPSPEIDILASLGMFFLMFHSGLETDPRFIRKTLRPSVWIGLSGISFPFLLGTGSTLLFGGSLIQAVLIGAAVSGTSMVTKSRILCDLQLDRSRIGYQMMGAAIFDNITIFLIISLIIKSTQNGGFSLSDALMTTLEILIFFAITLTAGYLLFPKLSRYFTTRRGKGFTFALLMGFIFAFLAEAIRLPFILGAYIAGLFVREEIMSASLFQKMHDRFLAISHGFLGPIFIMSIALKINLNVVVKQFWFVAVLFLVAFSGKLLGVYLGGRASGSSSNESLIMGLAMNGRGEIELIIALIGLQLGIINEDLMSVLVVVAFATTLCAPLILNKYMLKCPPKLALIED
ncbi:MAG: cation:proton antiporter [Candidatus Saganbacteria bacterium]|nr:cation:proton antiporter [Candidatus Saganbacteria bacterium]